MLVFLTLFQRATASRLMDSVLVAELFYTDKRKFGSRHSIAACCRLFNTKILIVEISFQYFRSESYVFLGLQNAYPVDQVII